MPELPFFHVGLLVEDLDAAIESFGTRLGMEFATPMDSHLEGIQTPDGTLDLTIRCTYSRSGPPYLELMEAHDSGLFGREHLGLHHIGLWDSNCAATLEKMKSEGVGIDGAQSMQGFTVMALLDPKTLHGLRVELIADMAKPSIEGWVAAP